MADSVRGLHRNGTYSTLPHSDEEGVEASITAATDLPPDSQTPFATGGVASWMGAATPRLLFKAPHLESLHFALQQQTRLPLHAKYQHALADGQSLGEAAREAASHLSPLEIYARAAVGYESPSDIAQAMEQTKTYQTIPVQNASASTSEPLVVARVIEERHLSDPQRATLSNKDYAFVAAAGDLKGLNLDGSLDNVLGREPSLEPQKLLIMERQGERLFPATWDGVFEAAREHPDYSFAHEGREFEAKVAALPYKEILEKDVLLQGSAGELKAWYKTHQEPRGFTPEHFKARKELDRLVGANSYFAGDGVTRLKDGSAGAREYLMNNVAVKDITGEIAAVSLPQSPPSATVRRTTNPTNLHAPKIAVTKTGLSGGVAGAVTLARQVVTGKSISFAEAAEAAGGALTETVIEAGFNRLATTDIARSTAKRFTQVVDYASKNSSHLAKSLGHTAATQAAHGSRLLGGVGTVVGGIVESGIAAYKDYNNQDISRGEYIGKIGAAGTTATIAGAAAVAGGSLAAGVAGSLVAGIGLGATAVAAAPVVAAVTIGGAAAYATATVADTIGLNDAIVSFSKSIFG